MFSLIPVINYDLFTAVSSAISAALIIKAEYKHARIKYIINPKELIEEEGIVRKSKKITELYKVCQIDINQGFAGRILNYGDVKLETWGTALEMHNIRRPQLIASRINEMKKDLD